MQINEDLIGKKAFVKFSNMFVRVVILDIKNKYGRVRYLIRPIDGEGEKWVESVEFNTSKKK